MRRSFLLPAGLALLLTLRAFAQPPAAPAPAPEKAPEVAVAPDSPRASLQAYLDLARAGRFDEAARYLELSSADAARGAELARRLKAILDRFLWIDLETASPEPEGSKGDGLPAGMDELGTIAAGHDSRAPVRIRRVAGADGARWVFTRATVGRVDTWYAELPDRWLREHLPPALLKPGPKELLLWQWLLVPLLLLAAWGAGRLLGALTRRVLARAAARTQTTWDDLLLERVGPPLTLAWTLVALGASIPFLGLSVPAQRFFASVLGAGGAVTLFWTLWRSVDVGGAFLVTRPWALQSPSSKNLLAIGTKLVKVFVGTTGVVAALAALGYPVATLIAGLGIGGIAIAFGAQKTVENLFGSVALAADQPFRVGDFVKVEDLQGEVESIGLRSTRLRTPDRTLITIPNGKLSDMKVESLAARDRLRMTCTLPLVHDTTRAQMEKVLAGVEGVLRAHPRIWPDLLFVSFNGIGASSLDVEVVAWFQTTSWPEFLRARQEALLGFLKVVEEARTRLAHPTRTVRLSGAGEMGREGAARGK